MTIHPLLFVSFTMIVAITSFGLGKFSNTILSYPLTAQNIEPISHDLEHNELEKGYVASINGAKYYPRSCEAADGIDDENKIFFETKEMAQKAGYIRSKQCLDYID